MKMTHGPSLVPTKVCRVPGGQWTKSHARSSRSSSSTSSRHVPASTRKSSWLDSAWYMPVGLPGSSTASVNPTCSNCCGSSSGRCESTRPLLSKTQRPPNASFRSHAASATLTTNQPGLTGASPEPTSSSLASSTATVSPGDELLEAGLVADRFEVRVLGSHRTERLLALNGQAEMLDRVVLVAREALGAGEVVERHRVLRVCLDRLAAALDHLFVLPGLEELGERHPELVAGGLVGRARRSADRDQRRSRLFREGGALHVRLHEDEGAGGRVDALAVELEPRPARLHEVELLLPVVLGRLVVLVDDPVTGLLAGPRVDPECGDPQVVAHRPPRGTAVGDDLDLVEGGDCVLAHGPPFSPEASGRARATTRARRPPPVRPSRPCP